jgi:cell division protein FtsB
VTVAKRVVGPALVVLVIVGILFVAVLPTRTLLQQRRDTKAATAELKELRERNAQLEERARRLHDPREIEQLAREQYGLVRPGEEPYVVLPAPPPPAAQDEGDDQNLPERVWDALTGIL